MAELTATQMLVVIERAGLDAAIERLRNSFYTEAFAGLDAAEQDRLKRQVVHMQAYSDVLAERMAAFG